MEIVILRKINGMNPLRLYYIIPFLIVFGGATENSIFRLYPTSSRYLFLSLHYICLSLISLCLRLSFALSTLYVSLSTFFLSVSFALPFSLAFAFALSVAKFALDLALELDFHFRSPVLSRFLSPLLSLAILLSSLSLALDVFTLDFFIIDRSRHSLCIPQDLDPKPATETELCWVFLRRKRFSTEIIKCTSPEVLQPTVMNYINRLQSTSSAVKRSAAADLRVLAKDRSDIRALIGKSGAIPALIPLLRCSDPWTQEHAVTALFNLSLHEENLITCAVAIRPLVYVLETGTETSKQSAACALMRLSSIDRNRMSIDRNRKFIGECGAIPPLVSLLINGSNRGKKDALTTLYILCSVELNKERAVSAGAVMPLVVMVEMQEPEIAVKAIVILSSLAAIQEGRAAIVEEGGIPVLIEVINDGSVEEKECALLTLLQLCADSLSNRGLLLRDDGIPPLVALSQSGTATAKDRAKTLLQYLTIEPRQEASISGP